jgi:hypothetical protein
MKKKLLFLALILLTTLKGFSQAEAYPAPDINQCGSEVFNLTVQTPIILGNQDPLNFTVTYYLTQVDAAAGTNPVVNPAFYVSPQQQLIFAKVVNLLDSTSDITVFNLSWSSGVFVPDLSDVQVCDAYELQPLTVGNYYTGPNGTGVMISPADIITQTQTIYIYAENNLGCTDQSDFIVTIVPVPVFNDPEPLTACLLNNDGLAIFDLTVAIPQILGNVTGYTCTFHQTQAAAENGVNAIVNPQAYYPLINIVYISIVQTGTVSNCRWVAPIQLTPIVCAGSTIAGFVSLNFDGDCESFEMAASGIPVYMTHNNDVYIAYTNADGYYYFINVPDGNNTIYVNAASSTTVSPSSYAITMPGETDQMNFCITLEPINDVAVSVYPITTARPGFPASYAVIYQNLGTVTQSGEITLQFDSNNLAFSNATPAMVQSGNTLALSYTNLLPFQSKTAIVVFTVNLPQITPLGTVLNFTANITGLTGDINTANNTSVVSQVVVNSFDPNDITVREGEFITEAQTDEYLNYTVRFQTTGSANAENVRVVIALDENLDWSTFKAMTASHAFTVKHTGNEVEFLFNNIDLAYENEATGEVPESNGHFIYRIKPKASVTLGDSMSAQADIYFDFNDPIETNTVTTTVQNVAGLAKNSLDSFTVYPNPASESVNLILANTDATGFDVAVVDVLGKTILKSNFQSNEAKLDITSLNSGVYFINVVTDGKQSTKKLIIR